MIIAIAVAASLVAYAWIMGYIGFTNVKSEKSIVIQSITKHETGLLVYVQNVGRGEVKLKKDGCLYIDDKLVDCFFFAVPFSDGTATLNEGKTTALLDTSGPVSAGEKVKVKVVTVSGTFSEIYAYPAEGPGGTPVCDHFEFFSIESPQTAGAPFTITIWALDQHNIPFTSYSGTNSLFISDGVISPSVTGDFSNGAWTGEVTVVGSVADAYITTVAESDSSWTGISNTFNVSIEEWSQHYGGPGQDWATSLVVTSDGGYALAGITSSFGAGQDDCWLVKTDSRGNMEWSRTYGGEQTDCAYSLVTVSDGGYALAGYTYSFPFPQEDPQRELWLVKTDASGNMEWNEVFGGSYLDEAESLIETSDGGYALAGWTTSFGAGHQDLLLAKFDSYGNLEWNQTYGGADPDYGHGMVVETVDGGYAVAGSTTSYGAGGHDFWLVKTDSTGNLEWSKTFGGAGDERAFSLFVTSYGGYVISGTATSIEGVDGGWLIKTDAAGNVEWSKTYESTMRSMIATSDGGYAFIGEEDVDGGVRNLVFVKTDVYGTVEWTRTIGGPEDGKGFSLVETPDGGYAIGGVTQLFEPLSDFWLVKIG